MKYQVVNEEQASPSDSSGQAWYKPLLEIVGAENVLTGFADRLAYGRDRFPLASLRYRFGHLPGTLPRVVVMPGSYREVSQVLELMNRHQQPVIPYGAGSGVLGGAMPLSHEVTIDLKRLNKVINLDEISGLASVQGGMNGELFEAYLNKSRLTLGHFPQSLSISTVGGWVSCRSAGQASSRYGKIEDMVVGLKVILADGSMVEVNPAPRRAVGPGLKDLFVGAEGTMGIVVEATFRVLPYPELETVWGIGFPDYLSGLEALRRIMQAELRPGVARLYDAPEAATRVSEYPDYKDHPCLCMLTFMGKKELVEVEEKLALDICKEVGGKICSNEPTLTWLSKRYVSLSAQPIFEGLMVDAIEIAAPWRSIPPMYEGARQAVLAVNPEAHLGVHWSHAYTDGAGMYMTFKIPAMDEELAAKQYEEIWAGVMKVCLDEGGTISHHHGVGYFRSPWLKQELGEIGHGLLNSIKRVVDPNCIMNPGKLGLG